MSDRGGIEAGKAYVTIYGDKSPLTRDLKEAGKLTLDAGKAMLAASGVVIAGMLASVKVFAVVGDQIQKMSIKTGVGAEALSSLDYAAGQSGSSLEAIGPAIGKMQKYLVEANTAGGEALDTLTALGGKDWFDGLNNLPPSEQFKAIADKIAAIQDPATKTAVAMRIFGKSGADLLPLLQEGSSGIAKLEADAKRLGLVMSQDMANKAAETGDRIDDLTKVVKQAAVEIGYALAPAIIKVATAITEAVVSVNKFIAENHELVDGAAKAALAFSALSLGVVVAGSALVKIGTLISTAAGVVAFAGGVIEATFFAIAEAAVETSLVIAGVTATNPWIALATIVAAATVALVAIGLAAYHAISPIKEEGKAVFDLSVGVDRLERSLKNAAAARDKLTKAMADGKQSDADAAKVGFESAVNQTILGLQEHEQHRRQSRRERGLDENPEQTDTARFLDQPTYDPGRAKKILDKFGIKDDLEVATTVSGRKVVMLLDLVNKLRDAVNAVKHEQVKPAAVIDLTGLKEKLAEESALIDAQNIKDAQNREKAQVGLKYDKLTAQDTTGQNAAAIAANKAKELAAIDGKYATLGADAIANLRIAGMEDGYDKEAAATDEHYRELLEKAKDNAEETQRLEAQKQQALANIQINAARSAMEKLRALQIGAIRNPWEAGAAAIEDTYKKDKADGNPKADEIRSQAYTNLGNSEADKARAEERENLKLELQLQTRNESQLEQRRKMIDLEQKFADKDANDKHLSPEQKARIDYRFDLERKLLDPPHIETRGILSSFALQSLQGGGSGSTAERTAKATETSAALNARILKKLDDFYAPEFGS